MVDTVWVSLAPATLEVAVALEDDLTLRDQAFSMDCVRRDSRGEALPRECFPKQINIDPNPDRPDIFDRVRHLFSGNYWFVSAQCAAVLRSHDLGGGALYSVEFFQMDRRTKVPGGYYALNIGNTKRTFVPELSSNAPKNPYAATLYQLWPIAGDDDIAVTKDALVGHDIWIEPTLSGSFFLSDKLASALRSGGCDAPFQLRRCRIV